jgi:hypothetical protein
MMDEMTAHGDVLASAIDDGSVRHCGLHTCPQVRSSHLVPGNQSGGERLIVIESIAFTDAAFGRLMQETVAAFLRHWRRLFFGKHYRDHAASARNGRFDFVGIRKVWH